ncbi:MAG: hypothetical protein LQ338_000148 [Usnochroma carphineum]|nr:MAG: hypothetical protein LQ338_000148 [Usnochroma carphineum]
MDYGTGCMQIVHDDGQVQGRAVTTWDPTFLTINGAKNGDQRDSSPVYSIIVLNQPIQSIKQLASLGDGGNPCIRSAHNVSRLIDYVAWRVVYADGGATQVYETAKTDEEESQMVCWLLLVQQPWILTIAQLPDIICGDLDSLGEETEQYFKMHDTTFVLDDNQYQTDLQKCLKQVKNLAQDWQGNLSNGHSAPPTDTARQMNVVLIGGIGGRFDHGFSQLHHLYQENVDEDYAFRGRIWLANRDSICFLLSKGLNHIKTPVGDGQFGRCVGIIPIGRPSVVRTEGLEWNLRGEVTEFGGLMSTSNHITQDSIVVDTSERVLLTIELDEFQRTLTPHFDTTESSGSTQAVDPA